MKSEFNKYSKRLYKSTSKKEKGATKETGKTAYSAGAEKPKKTRRSASFVRKVSAKSGFTTGRIAAITALSLVAVLLVSALSIYTILAGQIDGKKTQAGTLPDQVKTLPEYTGKGILNILVCGLDYPDENETMAGSEGKDLPARTDMILYVHYDTVNNQVRIMQIPRDTYVGLEVNTGGTGKINGVYYGAEDAENRMAALAQVLNDQFGLPVDYYATIDMDAVKQLVDIKGSIEVYVPVDVADGRYEGVEIPAGWRNFTSPEAEFFLRNRNSPAYKEQGDIMRMQMQQSFYSALFQEFKSLNTKELLKWVDVLLDHCHTDMDAIQIGGLARKAMNIEGADITFIRPAVSGAMLGDSMLVSLVPDEMAALMNQYFRPEGHTVPLEELNIQTLPVVAGVGTYESNVRTMTDVQAEEAPR